MVDIYESDNPSAIEVILESRSFQEALDHIHYLNAIAAQDEQIAAAVADARDEARAARRGPEIVLVRVPVFFLVGAGDVVVERLHLARQRARRQPVRDALGAS